MSTEERSSQDTNAAAAHRPRAVPVNEDNFKDIIGRVVYGRRNQVIGEAWELYRREGSHKPQWLTVRTSLFRASEYFVPLAIRSHDGGVRVNYDKQTFRHSPRFDVEDGLLSEWERSELSRHYGLDG